MHNINFLHLFKHFPGVRSPKFIPYNSQVLVPSNFFKKDILTVDNCQYYTSYFIGVLSRDIGVFYTTESYICCASKGRSG